MCSDSLFGILVQSGALPKCFKGGDYLDVGLPLA